MNTDILTLVREIEIIRNENSKLKEENSSLKLLNKKLKSYKSLIYQTMKFNCFLANSRNESISKRAIGLLENYNEVKVSFGEKPIKPVGYYDTLKKEKSESEKIIG